MQYFIVIAGMGRVDLGPCHWKAQARCVCECWDLNDIDWDLGFALPSLVEEPVVVVGIERIGMDIVAIEEAA